MQKRYRRSSCEECPFNKQCAKFDEVADDVVEEYIAALGNALAKPEDTPGETTGERIMNAVTTTIADYLQRAFCYGVYGVSRVNLGQMATDIIKQILALVNRGSVVSFEKDWGDNTITIVIDHAHSHCGFPDGDFVALVDSLHDLLVNGHGLSFVKDR